MKIAKIINSVNTYNNYLFKIRLYRKQQEFCDAFDDKEGVEKLQIKIEQTQEEIGKLLDTEV